MVRFLENRQKSISVYILTIFLIILGLFVLFHAKHSKSVSLLPSKAELYNTGWYYYDENGKPVEVELPCRIPAEGNVCRLYHRHTSYTRTKLCFYTHHQSANLFLNEVPLYEYDVQVKPKWLKSYRSFYHIVTLPAVKNGEICLELTALIPKHAGEYNSILMGTYESILFRLIFNRLDKVLLGIILVIFSLLVLLMSSMYNPNRGGDRTMIHLGVLAMLVGVWQLEESRVLQLFIGNQGIHWCLEYLMQFFILLVSIRFIHDVTPKNMNLLTLIFFFISELISVALLLFQVFGIIQFADSVVVIKILFIFYCFYAAYIVNKNNSFKKRKVQFLFTVFMTISALLFVVVVLGIFQKKITDILMSIAFAFMFVSLSLILYHTSFEKFEAVRNAQLYQKLAFVDFNTGVSSKTAWFSLVENFDPHKDKLISCCLILFDMNNLKKLNDTKGHLFGDKVINEFCHCLSEAFGDNGTIFRIGGDEFICLCRHSSEQEVEQMLASFDRMSANPRNPEYAFSCAYGYVFFTPHKKQDF
ncbi:MAG: GGDEF domain-containing protein, partial [Treponema sp.]|nr:GGDEF domain-containing protein [Treponema sp.]